MGPYLFPPIIFFKWVKYLFYWKIFLIFYHRNPKFIAVLYTNSFEFYYRPPMSATRILPEKHVAIAHFVILLSGWNNAKCLNIVFCLLSITCNHPTCLRIECQAQLLIAPKFTILHDKLIGKFSHKAHNTYNWATGGRVGGM